MSQAQKDKHCMFSLSYEGPRLKFLDRCVEDGMNVSRAQRGRKEPCEACVEEGSCKCGRQTHAGKTEQETLRERLKGSGGRGMERFAQRSAYFLLRY